MRLADGEIIITLDDRSFTLRASLRAVAVIARDYHDLNTLYSDVASLRLGAALDLIKATSTDPIQFAVFEAMTAERPLMDTISRVRPQLLAFIEKIAGSSEGDAKPTKVSDPITLDEYVSRLFRIGAGWLEWSPDQVWNATPVEIIEAHKGLIEKLKAIHGSNSDDSQTVEGIDSHARARLNALGNTSIHNMAQVP